MGPGKAVSVVRLQPAKINEDNVFFELHRLTSEQSRLLRTRAIMSERIWEIDERVTEIRAMINIIKAQHRI
ncbi:MAG: hypothetical protein ABSC17_01020 [Thermacetogeniaceae bacterium]